MMENKNIEPEIKVIDCLRCEGDACFKLIFKDKRWASKCWGCGFTTHSELKGDQAINLIYGKNTPKLYVDLIFKDKDGYYWIPEYTDLEGKGVVFIDGKNVNDWSWASIKHVPILPTEKHRFPEGTKYKTDPKTLTKFGQKGYMDALEEIGGFNILDS